MQVRDLQRPGEGVPGDVSDNGEPILIQEADDERLLRRNKQIPDGGVRSLIVSPLMDRDSLVGVVEAVRSVNGEPFDDDSLFTLSRLANRLLSLCTTQACLQPSAR